MRTKSTPAASKLYLVDLPDTDWSEVLGATNDAARGVALKPSKITI